MTNSPYLILKFFEGRDGRPIARLPSGKIALPTRGGRISPRAGERYLCSLVREKDNYALVQVLTRAQYTRITVYACGHRKQETVEAKEGEEDLVLKGYSELKLYAETLGGMAMLGCPACSEQAKRKLEEQGKQRWQKIQQRRQEIERMIREKIKVNRITVHEEYRAEPKYEEPLFSYYEDKENSSKPIGIKYTKIRADREVTKSRRRTSEEAAIEDVVDAVYAEEYMERVGSDNYTESDELVDDERYQRLKEGVSKLKEIKVTLYKIQCKVTEVRIPEEYDYLSDELRHEWVEYLVEMNNNGGDVNG